MDAEAKVEQTNAPEPVPVSRDWIGGTFRVLAIVCALGLLALYLFVGDTTAWGEYLTVWPPILWCAGLVPLAVLGTRRKRWRASLVAWGAVALFAMMLIDLPKVTILATRSADRYEFDLVTWNMGAFGGTFSELLSNEDVPFGDVYLLQETPDDESNGGTINVGARDGYHVYDRGDCAVVSRYPITPLPTRPVGPWEEPLLATIDMPGSRTLLVANVRLVLPSLVLDPTTKRNRERLVADHRRRVDQFPALAELLRETIEAVRPDGVVLAGDFNTCGGAKSLEPLNDILTDRWPRAGRGWGGTMSADFPVARIDQIWTSEELYPARMHVGNPATSDHRPVRAVLRWTE